MTNNRCSVWLINPYNRLKADSTISSYPDISGKVVTADNLSAEAFQFLPAEYWDKDSLFSLHPLSDSQLETSIQLKKHEGIQSFFSIEKLDGVFALLLICFFFLAYVHKGGLLFFKENLKLIFTNRQKVNLLNETTVTEFWYNFMLISLYVLLSSIILFVHFIDQYPLEIHQNSFLVIIAFSVIIALLLGFKLLFYKFVGYVFFIRKKIKIWIRSYVVLLEIVGIILFVPVLLLVYSDYFHDILMIFFLSLFILSRLIIIYRITGFFLQENVNFLFLIAYLCSAEIIPYILLYEGLAYLFKIDILNLL